MKINGKSHQNAIQYGYICNILHDFTRGNDAVAENKLVVILIHHENQLGRMDIRHVMQAIFLEIHLKWLG